MKIVPAFSSQVRVVAAVLTFGIGGNASLAEPVDAIEAAADGRALEAVLSRDAGTREQVAARAKALGLQLVEIRVGLPDALQTELRIAGGARPFADCAPEAGCPPMVAIPSSPHGFMIGSPPDEPDRMEDEAQTAVSIKAFAIGAHAVTVAEYKACVADGGCPQPEWLEPDGQHNIETGSSRYYKNLGDSLTNPNQPIVGVSQTDATAYAAWLAKRTGHAYRLPSEAEWEFAARAGTTTAYWWGNSAEATDPPRAACNGCGSEWDGKAPAPADAFEPNPWGLYSVHGNVWEWMADFYCDDYASGPKDGTARVIDECAAVGDRPPARGVKSLRGGSAYYSAKMMRAAMRARNVPSFRNFSVGFRVARDLTP